MDGKNLLDKFGKKISSLGGGPEQGPTPPQTPPESPIPQITMKDLAEKLDKILKAVKEGNASLKKIEVSLGPVGPEEGGKKSGAK